MVSKALVQREAEVCISEKCVKFIGDIYIYIYIYPETHPSAASANCQHDINPGFAEPVLGYQQKVSYKGSFLKFKSENLHQLQGLGRIRLH